MRNFNDESGFTLVELMVVVAIIGILSAVAIPNFKRYQAKSKTTEAKVNLASVYTAEMSHYTDMDQYSACLRAIGYEPGGLPTDRYYTIGFGPGTSDPGGLTGCATGPNESFFQGQKGGQASQEGSLSGITNINNGAAPPTFTAGAAGIIQPGNQADIWTVNEQKTVLNTVRGF